MIIFKYKKREKGSALAMVLVMVLVVAMMLTSLLSYISSQIKYSKDRVERESAFQIAEAGIYYYKWYLAHKVTEPIANFWETDNLTTGDPVGVYRPYTAQFKDSEGNALGEYKLEVTKPEAGSTIVIVKSTGWTYKKPSINRIVQVRFRKPSWSEYTFLSNSFMNFGDQSVVYGKIHSNDGIRFDGLAYNTVSSSVPSFDDPTYGGNRLEFGVHTTTNPADPEASEPLPVRSDIFVAGREFPTANVSFPGLSSVLDAIKTQALNNNGEYFDSAGIGRRINLKSDGTFDVCIVKTANANTHAITRYWKNDMSGWCNNCSGACLSNHPIINKGVIFVENNIWLEGSINNKNVTIAAADLSGGGVQADIYIGISNNNLRYAAYNCSNMLGLIAQRDVRVLADCPNNFTVDASLVAQTGTVGINDNGPFGAKGALIFNGAIASFLQPYFQHGNSGFADRTYNYDNNLLYCPPPYFPTGTEYSIDQWDEL